MGAWSLKLTILAMSNIDLSFPHQYLHTSHRVFESYNRIITFWLSHRIELKDSNFPENLVKVFMGQAVDIARRCVEEPLRRRPKYVHLKTHIC